MVILNEKYQNKVEFSISANLFPRAPKRKTTDRLIQRKVKLDRRKSASAMKVEIENQLRISLHVETIRNRAHCSGE